MGSPQKVVIPKGLINPNETTIVEIPQALQNVGTVVARRKQTPKNNTSAKCPPPKSAKNVKKPANQLKLRYQEQSPGRECRIEYESSGHDISYKKTSVYKDFKPPHKSTPAKRPTTARKPAANACGPCSPCNQHYPEEESSGEQESPSASGKIYAKVSITSCTSEGVCSQAEVSGEEPFSYSSSSYNSPGGGESSSCPCTESSGEGNQNNGSSGGYKRFDSGGYSPEPPVCGEGANASKDDLMHSMDELEACEVDQILSDLCSFQSARRKLVMDASNLASPTHVSANKK